MIKNSYLKFFLIAGIPIIFFFTALFSFVLGTKKGLIDGFLMGLFIGGPISLFLGFFYSKFMTATRNTLYELGDELKPGSKLKNLSLFLPCSILLTGAIFTRFYGHLIFSFIVTITLSIISLIILIIFSKTLQARLQEMNTLGKIAYTLSSLIPFTTVYFGFLFAICGFNIDKLKALFVS